MATRMKTWMIILLLSVTMAVIMKENIVDLLGMWGEELENFPYDQENRLQAAGVRFAGEFLGSESLAFDLEGRGPYTGVSDGRILRWEEPQKPWTYFAYTSPIRSGECAPKNPPAPNFDYEHICGRPLGLRFDKHGTLFIADAYFGLLTVAPHGGLAQPLVTQVEDTNLTFTNDLDFDTQGFIYFTDSSSKHQRRNFLLMFIEGDNTGRLIRYDPKTGATTVVLRGLQFPNGVAVSKDGTFLLISETITCRLLRYWLKGPKMGTVEVFASLPGYPDNVRLSENGDFWVAIHGLPNPFLKIPVSIRRLVLRLPLPLTKIFSKMSAKRGRGMIIRYGIDGQMLEVLEDKKGLVVKSVSEVEEKDGILWLGSVLLPHIVVYNNSHQVSCDM
ncbi:protein STRICTOSIDINE SYNTHASE-LIKE 10 isoform X2 [Cryptomeria japonica]|uniref:protein STRICTOSIDINE SYNTHASE-LIKE 10 isoform X2 n=1 Tax=Cryptomeria japonica TaxID=3369 RepID=UPI0027DA5F18|nr:protein STRICTOSIDINE SYNTHASE-LIKE 10 isoform X2 [Cryptomeria japonica]